jgi:hypothetical protein
MTYLMRDNGPRALHFLGASKALPIAKDLDAPPIFGEYYGLLTNCTIWASDIHDPLARKGETGGICQPRVEEGKSIVPLPPARLTEEVLRRCGALEECSDAYDISRGMAPR